MSLTANWLADGSTHAGSFDNAYLGTLPNMEMTAAADEAELKHMATHGRLASIRALCRPRGEGAEELSAHGEALKIGKGRIIRGVSVFARRAAA